MWGFGETAEKRLWLETVTLRKLFPQPGPLPCRNLCEELSESLSVAVIARTDVVFQQCISPACSATFSVEEALTACPACGNLLDVSYDWDRLRPPTSFEVFERKWMRRSDPLATSGVWRFHELLPFAPRESVVTIGEGQTLLAASDGVGSFIGMKPGRLYLQYEGLNPS